MSTETVKRAQRLHHLSARQRWEIHRDIAAALDGHVTMASRIRVKNDEVKRLAQRFGVPGRVIVDSYERSATQRAERSLRERQARLRDRVHPSGLIMPSEPQGSAKPQVNTEGAN